MTIVLVFQSLSQKMSTSAIMDIPADNETLQLLKSTMQTLFLDCSVVLTYQQELVQTSPACGDDQKVDANDDPPNNVLVFSGAFHTRI